MRVQIFRTRRLASLELKDMQARQRPSRLGLTKGWTSTGRSVNTTRLASPRQGSIVDRFITKEVERTPEAGQGIYRIEIDGISDRNLLKRARAPI